MPPSEIGLKFDDIGALESVKETLREVVMLPLQVRGGAQLAPCAVPQRLWVAVLHGPCMFAFSHRLLNAGNGGSWVQ